MLISVIIPTRDRAEVLKYSLASCVRIADRDLEIIVSDNASVDDTADVVAKFQDRRLRYICTPQRCSMRQNFEFAVGHASGDYIFTLGDDDALLPNQFPYLRSLLERYAPDTLTSSIVRYAWPSPEAANNGGRLKLRFKSLYGDTTMLSGEYLREGLERDGAVFTRHLPRIYGGASSRRVIEELKKKTGQLFMASWPDYYFSFASPSVIERHLVVNHPFFLGGSSPKSNGASYHRWRKKEGDGKEAKKFQAEADADPVADMIPATLSFQTGVLSHLESANRYAYGGSLRIDYEREFERIIPSLNDLDQGPREFAANALAGFAAERNLSPALCDAQAILSRCKPAAAPRSPRRPPARIPSYLFFDRVVVNISGSERTDVDAAAATYEYLIGEQPNPIRRRSRLLAWGQLLRRALQLMRGSVKL